jgi:hypothetical protein
MSYEELWNASEEKDATILELQQAAKTARAALKTEKKQVEGKSPLLILCLPLGFVEIRSRLTFFLFFRSTGRSRGRQQRKQRRSRRPTTPPSGN